MAENLIDLYITAHNLVSDVTIKLCQRFSLVNEENRNHTAVQKFAIRQAK